MNPRSKTRERVFTVTFMFLVTLVCISGVAGVHLATRDIVAANAKLFLQRAVMEAVGESVPAEGAAVRAWYAARVAPHPDAANPDGFTVTTPEGAVRAYVFVRSGAGLWGTITAVVGLQPDLKALTGLTIIRQDETPGLGARIDEAWFKQQFRGKAGPFRRVPEKTRSQAPQEIDGITGATITTEAVLGIAGRTMAGAGDAVAGWGAASR